SLVACGRESAPPAAIPEPVASLPAEAIGSTPFQRAKAEFEARAAVRIASLSDPRHAPLLLDHGHATRYAVVITPGLYDSAYGQRPLADRFFKRGFNVMVPLLPGHWDQDRARIDSATYAEYVEEQNTSIRLAKAMGQELILVGHSTGALLALRSAIAEKEVAALVVSAPAFGLSPFTTAATAIGLTLNLSANFIFGPADGITRPYLSPFAGDQVRKLIKLTRNENGWVRNKVPAGQSESGLYQKLFAKVEIPSVLVTGDGDLTIDNRIAGMLPRSARGPSLHLTSPVLGHFEVGRYPYPESDSPKDRAYTAENKRLADAAESFLIAHLPDYLNADKGQVPVPSRGPNASSLTLRGLRMPGALAQALR
ncbi:MAG: alpha/beta fold hydrolase, partial [Proteobacteria bacterium]